MNIYAVTGYQDFYHKPYPEDWKELLRRYHTDLVIMNLVKINATLFLEGGGNEVVQQKLVLEIFPLLEVGKLMIMQSLRREDRFQATNMPVWFNEQGIIKLIALSCQQYIPVPDDDTADFTKFQNDLFDFILIANQIYYQEIVPYDMLSYEHLWQLNLMQQGYLRDFANIYQPASLKYMMLLKFIKAELSNGESFLTEFAENIGLSGYNEYSAVFLDILKGLFDSYKNDGKIRWNLGRDHVQLNFIEQFCLRPADLEAGNMQGFAHEELVPKPFYLLRNEVPVILDFNFFWHLIDTALVFTIYKFSPSCQREFAKFGDFYSVMAKRFYEEYLAARLLASIYDQPYEKVLTDKEIGSVTDIAIVQNKKDIFLIEVKAARLHYKILDSVDIEGFKLFIEKNFITSKEKGGKNRGSFQLARAMKELTDGRLCEVLGINNGELKKCTIYPVIIYTDPVLDVAAANSYCNDNFLPGITELTAGFKKVYPLTMININFILSHYLYLKKDRALLKKLISQYHSRLMSVKKSPAKSGDPVVYFNAHASFATFVNTLDISPFKNTDNMRAVVKDFSLTAK